MMVPEVSSLAAATNESSRFTVLRGDSVGERRATVFGACSFSRTRQRDRVRSVRLHSHERQVEERRRSAKQRLPATRAHLAVWMQKLFPDEARTPLPAHPEPSSPGEPP